MNLKNLHRLKKWNRIFQLLVKLICKIYLKTSLKMLETIQTAKSYFGSWNSSNRNINNLDLYTQIIKKL
jgi:hypothetical protein